MRVRFPRRYGAAGTCRLSSLSGQPDPFRQGSQGGAMHVNRYVLITLLVVCFAAGCSQTTYKAATFRQTVTTNVEITSNVPAQVWISDRNVGTTPLSFPFSYEEEVDRNVKTSNYWETNPGAAAALSVLSFGTYIPFSFIPVEPESKTRPAGKYFNNKLSLRLVAEGYEPLDHVVECKGDREIKVTLNLDAKPTE